MSLLGDSFMENKVEEPVSNKVKESISSNTEYKLKQIIDEFMREAPALPSIVLNHERRPVHVYGSKFGGRPYMPKGFEYPRDGNGKPLKLLAQLNFNELPQLANFPQKGILQFFARAGEDTVSGVDFDNLANQDGFRVIYHKDIVSDDMLSDDDIPELSSEYFPFEGEFAITGEEQLCPITMSDYCFKEKFLNIYKKYINTDATSLYQLGDDIYHVISDKFTGESHRIGGYPYFTQSDPRETNEDLRKYNVLLLQIISDSDGWGHSEICWGDCGVANFFISLDDLIACDFSDIIYTWDC